MKPHQQRVLDEKAELDDNIQRLGAFIEGDIFVKLPVDEQADLRIQLGQMQMYSDTLKRRIERFG